MERSGLRSHLSGSLPISIAVHLVAVLLFLINIPVYAVFGMAGSLLGLAIFRKKMPPPAPPIG